MKRMFLKPVPRSSVQARDMQMYHVYDKDTKSTKATQRLKRTKAKDSPEKLIFERSEDGLRLKSGMSEVIDNPFYQANPEEVRITYNLSEKWLSLLDKIVGEKTITKQTELEIRASVDPGTYTDVCTTKRIPGSVFLMTDSNEIRTELEKFSYVLYDRTNILEDTTPRMRLAMQAALNSRLVAPNKESINQNYHHFYIAREFEEEEQEIKLERIYKNAVATLVSFESKYSTIDQYRLATVLRDDSETSLVTAGANSVIVERALNNFISQKQKRFKQNCQSFIDLVEMFEKQPEKFHLHYLVREGLNRNVLSTGGYLFWHSKSSDPVAYKFNTVDSFIAFLYQHMERYNPKEPGTQNYYYDFIVELQDKGVNI